MIHAFIMTHGRLGGELIRTAEGIFGRVTDCVFQSNDGLSDRELFDRLDSFLNEHEEEPCVIFVDFFGGSCATVCQRVLRHHASAYLVGGVNLPILLTFLNKRSQLGIHDLIDHLLIRGRESIALAEIKAV